jgi:hypothetical protein
MFEVKVYRQLSDLARPPIAARRNEAELDPDRALAVLMDYICRQTQADEWAVQEDGAIDQRVPDGLSGHEQRLEDARLPCGVRAHQDVQPAQVESPSCFFPEGAEPLTHQVCNG